MNYSTHAPIVAGGAAALIVAIASIGWWMSSSPDNVRQAAQAIVMLAGMICSIQHCRRLPKPSPLLVCGSIVGLGVPFFTASVGPMFTTVLAVSVVIAWTGIGIARVRTPSHTR